MRERTIRLKRQRQDITSYVLLHRHYSHDALSWKYVCDRKRKKRGGGVTRKKKSLCRRKVIEANLFELKAWLLERISFIHDFRWYLVIIFCKTWERERDDQRHRLSTNNISTTSEFYGTWIPFFRIFCPLNSRKCQPNHYSQCSLHWRRWEGLLFLSKRERFNCSSSSRSRWWDESEKPMKWLTTSSVTETEWPWRELELKGRVIHDVQSLPIWEPRAGKRGSKSEQKFLWQWISRGRRTFVLFLWNHWLSGKRLPLGVPLSCIQLCVTHKTSDSERTSCGFTTV